MTATTHTEFGPKTEGLEVAQAFASSIRGKTVIVTGVNPRGIGFATAEAFVSVIHARRVLVCQQITGLSVT